MAQKEIVKNQTRCTEKTKEKKTTWHTKQRKIKHMAQKRNCEKYTRHKKQRNRNREKSNTWHNKKQRKIQHIAQKLEKN